MLAKAEERGKVEYHVLNLFKFLDNENDRIDDYPFGGGNGMIIKPGPVFNAYESINDVSRVIFPTPDGELLNHKLAKNLSKEKSLVFICGHYKGIDQRIRDAIVTDEVSIGDFVLSGGEIPVLAVIDAVARLIPGVLGDESSAKHDSFMGGIFDTPHYTRPKEIDGQSVPEVLLSGDHERIIKWRAEQAIGRTYLRRPDLIKKLNLNEEQKTMIEEYLKNHLLYDQ